MQFDVMAFTGWQSKCQHQQNSNRRCYIHLSSQLKVEMSPLLGGR